MQLCSHDVLALPINAVRAIVQCLMTHNRNYVDIETKTKNTAVSNYISDTMELHCLFIYVSKIGTVRILNRYFCVTWLAWMLHCSLRIEKFGLFAVAISLDFDQNIQITPQ